MTGTATSTGQRSEVTGPGGSRLLLSGNQAVARGAADAGVSFVSAFPGGPTTGLVYALAELSAHGGPQVQWSLNEKVAVEAAAGAAMGGVRAMAVMKHFGANNAADMIFAAPLMFIPGLVIVVGDDPQGHTSHSEQDTRPYPKAADMPCLEASSPQEAYELIGHAYDLSEELSVPVYLRLVKWLSDWAGPVTPRNDPTPASAPVWDSHHYQSRPILGQHRRLHSTLAQVPTVTSAWGMDRVEGPGGAAAVGVIASGNAYHFVLEALERHGASAQVPVAKLSTINPLPEGVLEPFLGRCERVLVVEEIEPVVEEGVAVLAHRAGLATQVMGRGTGALPPVGELTPTMVTDAVGELVGATTTTSAGVHLDLPERPAAPAPGNPHRPTFFALRRFARRHENVVFMGDVGEAASIGRPFMKAHSAMGAGIGMAVGAARSDPSALVVTVVGDGTLYGFALNGVADAVYNRARLVLLVVDNGTMESTGGQPTPTSTAGLRGDEAPLDIEGTLRAIGVHHLVKVDSRDITAVDEALEECAAVDGVSVVLAVGRPAEGLVERVEIDPQKAETYRKQIEEFACPALGFADGRAQIDGRLCVRVGDCKQIAPDAITVWPGTEREQR
ncbi:thiamine pyrophosphate-dependent enzyme [Georgenia sp. M64]|uniref:thiamine pyrophosphate-dependent enzyme n=1 Tax=Georgenia sp. M64 TaxID=3120520 RepID=UPI0030E0F91C